MSIAQKSLAVIATLAVVVAVFASFVLTIQDARAAAVCPGHTFSTNLKMGTSGAEVMALQQFLNMDPATQVAASGVGSPGMETSYFGGLTKAAVIKFQEKYASDVLAPVGLTSGTGFFGASSRAKANAVCGGSTSTPAPAPGTGLGVSAPAQPANALAPANATRVPFTKVTLTAGNDGDVTVSGILIQRVGFGADAVFSGLILLDDNGMQIGTAKTFNSNHQATVGGTMTIARGTSKTYTIAANMGSTATLLAHAGEAPAISVVQIMTTATVSGSLPITGAYDTINSTLTTAALTLASSNAYATNASSTKQLGTTSYKFTGIRLTANSAEDITLRSVTFNQTGSVSASDLANLAVVVNGTSYPAIWSADGKYVTAMLGSGIVVTKGNQIEVYIQGDIVGSNSSGRTVQFHVDKNSDIYATGNTYNYGAGVTGGSSGTPYFYGMTVTVQGASVTSIAKEPTVAAQNIAPNVSNQPLGGFYVDLVGEGVSVSSMTFTVASSSGSAGDNILSITLVDENGAVVAGPVDEADVASGGNGIVFTDTVTFPTGKHKYTLRGKVSSATTNNATIIVSTNPSSLWSNVRGNTTGNSITLSNGNFAMNTMTVKAGSVAIGNAPSPASQNIVPGGSQVLMTNFQFDATQSGEDIRFASVPVVLGFGPAEGAPSKLSSCQLFDGATALNTGSNVLNLSTTATTSVDSNTITLDTPTVAVKGTVKTLGMRCNISSTADNNSTFKWMLATSTNFSFTGATSATTISGTNISSDPVIVVTISSGSTTVTTDATSPTVQPVSAGSIDKTIAAFKFRASNEALNLTKLGFSLTNSASSSAGDLVKVSIYNGATKVGEAYFAGSATTATSTFSTSVLLPKDTDKTLTIKADLADVGTSQAVTFSGHLLAVDYLNAEGTGADSGTTQQLSSGAGSTAVGGVRVFKSYPTVAKDTLASTGLADGDLMHFKVTADAKGPISLTEFNFNFATTSVTLSSVDVYAYTDASYSQPASGLQAGGKWTTTNPIGVLWANSTTNFSFIAYNGTASTSIQVPAGQTYYFAVRGSLAGVVSGSTVVTTLKGASSFVTCTTPAAATTNPLCKASAAGLTGDAGSTGNNFIWSPNTTTTPVRADLDWTGAAAIPGLPSSGLTSTRSQ